MIRRIHDATWPIDTNMEIKLRYPFHDDLAEIVRIEAHPLVRANQYSSGASTTADWDRMIFQGGFAALYKNFAIAVILVDGRTVGWIGRWLERSRGQNIANFGWNLDPDYWGRGIMPIVMSRNLNSLFADPKYDEARIECFHDNARCIRVLEKIGCESESIGRLDRALRMFRSRCLRWLVRYRMTRAMWESRQPMTSEAR